MRSIIGNCLEFCDRYDRMPYFYITGGDPILHPDFWRLLEALKEKEIPFTIMGNPFYITAEVCERLKECGCQKYQMSLDGLRSTHDWFRKSGSFDCTLDKIAVIKNAKIRAVIMTTVSGVNIKEIAALIDVGGTRR
jgi:MoaA/NifB/PqqE/SkfB family radical SAM enzyme